MTVKNLVTVALLVFVVISLGVFVTKEARRRSALSDPDDILKTQSTSATLEEGTTSAAEDTEVFSATPSKQAATSEETTDASEPTSEPEEAQATVAATNGSSDQPDTIQVIAYYLHNTNRCRTCLKIESVAREAMEEVFAENFASGELVWHSLDMEKPENEHFVYDYGLAMPSLVLVLTKEGLEVDWKRLDDTWTLIRNEQNFTKYVVEETQAYLGVH